MDSKKAGYLEGIVSIVVNTALFGLKFWAGTVSGSIALIADAWHTLSDSASSLVVIAGTRLSTKKADRDHPFGHGRWEYVASLFIGFMLGIIAWDILRESFLNFRAKESANFGIIAIVVTILSIVIKEALAQFAFRLGKKSGNTAVRADGWHHRSDALSSLVVLVGILMKNWFWWIDSLLGFVIALMLFYAVFEIVKEAIAKILGEEPSEELIGDVERIIKQNAPCEVYPHHYHIHNYVNHRELTFHIKLDKEMSVREAHDVVTLFENKIREQLNVEATIHMEPLESSPPKQGMVK